MPEIFSDTNTHPNTQPIGQPVLQPPTQLQPSSMHLLSAFAAHPKGISFADQTSDEEVILFLRKAFITNLSWIALTMIFFVLPIFVIATLQALHFTSFSLPSHFSPLLLIFYYLLVIGYAFANFITWFYNIGIVTPKRFLDITFKNITAISVAATAVKDVMDIEYSQKSFSESFFDYGDVTATIEETPSKPFIFESAPHPAKVVDIVSKLIQ